ncbi:hypothetical protein HDU93_009084 [Gonapodya sp. JEL0774]|nr:hypothetical protein HDU93_009084 [Gonapodya sp. JEL0774]
MPVAVSLESNRKEYGLTVGTRLGPDPPLKTVLQTVTTAAGLHTIASFVEPLPPSVDSSFAWRGNGADGLEARSELWTRTVTNAEIEEVEAAAERFAASGKKLVDLTKEDFPIPKLSNAIKDITRTVNDELGFFLLKGFPVKSWTREQSAIIFIGIGAHIGDLVPQNKKGHILGHVKDLKVDPNAPATRRYMTNARQGFHTDECDIVSLLCVETAPEGGESMVASSTTVYNELQKRYAELVPVLFAPWYWDRKNEENSEQTPFFVAPVYTWHAQRLLSFFVPYFATTTSRHEGVPPLSEEQKMAMQRLEEICEEVALRMRLEPGDIQVEFFGLIRGSVDDTDVRVTSVQCPSLSTITPFSTTALPGVTLPLKFATFSVSGSLLEVTMAPTAPLNIVSILGSIRPNRVGISVANYVNKIVVERGHSLTFVDPAEPHYELPLLKKRFIDYKDGEEVPENLKRLQAIFHAADAFILISPEYNANTSPVLANILDHFNNEYKRKVTAICNYSVSFAAGRLGGNNLRAMSAMLEMITVPMAHSWPNVGSNTFDENGVPRDAGWISRTEKFVSEVELYGSLMKSARTGH